MSHWPTSNQTTRASYDAVNRLFALLILLSRATIDPPARRHSGGVSLANIGITRFFMHLHLPGPEEAV